MATNEKVLQTRIVNKHALLTEWQSSTLQLKEGEIALAKVMVAQPDGTAAPTYVAKVGLEGKTFAECPMFYAPASDVHSWAKASTKPGYGADEITRGNSNVSADLKSVEDRISEVEGAIGTSGSVATQIDNKITAALDLLDLSEVTVGTGKIIGTIKQENGKVTVTTRDLAKEDIPTIEISQVNGLEAALNAKAVETSVAERFTAVDNKIGTTADEAGAATVYGAIATAKKAGDDAQKTIDDYKTANDAALAEVKATAEAARTESEVNSQIDAKIATFTTGTINPLADRVTAAEEAITAEKDRAEGIESGLNTRLTAAETAISNLNAATTFAGTGTYAAMNALENVKAGSIFVVIDTTDAGKQYNNKEFVYDGSKWVELGDTTAELAEISGLKDRVSAIEEDLGAEGDTTKAIAAAQKSANDAQASADAIYKVTGDTATGFLADEIARATRAESDNLATAKTYAEEKASAAQTAAEGTAKGYTDAEVKKVDDKVGELATTVSTNAQTAANATAAVAKDLSDYETANDAALDVVRTNAQKGVDDAAAALQYAKNLEDGAIKSNTDGVSANNTKITYIENNYARVSGNQLVYGQGDNEMVIVFDCGGAV